jgi:protein-S-isoprenylcysteine O-methyltransferase Ste14
MFPKKLMVPPLWLMLGLLAMLALDEALPIVEVVPERWRWVGLLIAGPGFLQGVWAISFFVKAQTPLHPHDDATSLITAGPYRYSRNPMYLGLLAVLIGTAIGFGSLSPWLIPPLFVAVITNQFIRPEERRLEARFGEAYRAYRASVRRWL